MQHTPVSNSPVTYALSLDVDPSSIGNFKWGKKLYVIRRGYLPCDAANTIVLATGLIVLADFFWAVGSSRFMDSK
jgi:hypothetical protein